VKRSGVVVLLAVAAVLAVAVALDPLFQYERVAGRVNWLAADAPGLDLTRFAHMPRAAANFE
jgi:hypothetical protein